MGLIDELYEPNIASKIKKLYSEDLESRSDLLKCFGKKIIEDQENFLLSKPIDVLCLICMTSSFANSELECQQVGVIFHKRIFDKNPLPYFCDDQGLIFAEKVLVSLSLYPKALEKRWKFHGAPKPSWYRNAAKVIFCKNEMDSIANNHEKWEAFFSEIFI